MVDKKDKEILYYLSKDFRLSKNKLKKQIKISQETINKRILNLENLKIIRGYKIGLSYTKLGFREFDVYLRIRKYNQTDFEKIINFFEKSNLIFWVGTSFGKFDFRLSLIVRESFDLNHLIEDFKKSFPSLLEDYEILEVLKKHKISMKNIFENLLGEKFDDMQVPNKVEENIKKYSLTKQEKTILKEFNKNPKTSLVSIANKIGLTAEAVSYNIKALEKKGVINSFSLILDGNKLDKIWAVFLFKLNFKKKEKFESFILKQKNVSSFVETLGSWDYSVSVFANNVKEIHEILMNFRNSFSDELIDYDMILLFETFKYPKIPQIIFE